MGKAQFAMSEPKQRFEKWRRSFRSDHHHAPLSQQEVMLASPDLGKQLEMRSSRDRVARGAFLNAVIGTLVLSRHDLIQSPVEIYLGGEGSALLPSARSPKPVRQAVESMPL